MHITQIGCSNCLDNMYSKSLTKPRNSSTFSTTRRQTYTTKSESPAHNLGRCAEETTSVRVPALLGIRGTRRYYRNSPKRSTCRSGPKPTAYSTGTPSTTIFAKNIWHSLNASTGSGCHVSPGWSGIWQGHVSLLSSKKARFIMSTLTLRVKRRRATTPRYYVTY